MRLEGRRAGDMGYVCGVNPNPGATGVRILGFATSGGGVIEGSNWEFVFLY